jgi:hypothetical protein
MLVADGGGGYGGTNWMTFDVAQMWAAIQNQDTAAHYEMLSGWQKSCELMIEHLGQVQNYRENLAAAWPPEKSPASAAYIERLDALIVDLQSTYEAAVANHAAFGAATLAISMSRSEVEKIYHEYAQNKAKLETFHNAPRPAYKAVAPPQKPPVADGRQEQLNTRARSIMFQLSTEILQAHAKIVEPPQYDPSNHVDAGSKETNGKPYTAPPIPPITSFHPDVGPSSATMPSTQHQQTLQPGSPGPPAPTTTPPGMDHHPGPILEGTTPPSLTPPPVAGTTPPPPMGGDYLPGIITPTPVIVGGPIKALPSDVSGQFSRTELPPVSAPPRGLVGEGLAPSASSGLRAMPPGGIIGGVPGAGFGQPGARGRSAIRVNPVGGLINPAESSARPIASGRGAMPSPMSSLGGRSTARAECDDSMHWDSENPWETAEGVSPVVLPVREQRVDPGPAIGLR